MIFVYDELYKLNGITTGSKSTAPCRLSSEPELLVSLAVSFVPVKMFSS